MTKNSLISTYSIDEYFGIPPNSELRVYKNVNIGVFLGIYGRQLNIRQTVPTTHQREEPIEFNLTVIFEPYKTVLILCT